MDGMLSRRTLLLAFAPRHRRLDDLERALGGNGSVSHNGRLVHSWSAQDQHFDWLSSAKPVLSTLLFFAIQEGKATSIDQPVADFGWPLIDKDRSMTLRHLANMMSGYARPDAPGAAWAYNDYGIMLYQKTLFDRIFNQDPDQAANSRLAALGLQDGLRFRPTNRRLSATVRDFARIAEFWLERGSAAGRQLLPRRFFEQYCRPQTPRDLPHTAKASTNDYLGVGTYGGGSDHFTDFGAGIYGCNWWFNGTGRLHPLAKTWPSATARTFMSIGAGGNCAVMVPEKRLVLVCARGQWGKHEPGNAGSATNQCIQILLNAL